MNIEIINETWAKFLENQTKMKKRKKQKRKIGRKKKMPEMCGASGPVRGEQDEFEMQNRQTWIKPGHMTLSLNIYMFTFT